MFLMADPNVTMKFDSSCSTDPDLSPKIYGPAAQGTLYVEMKINGFQHLCKQSLICTLKNK